MIEGESTEANVTEEYDPRLAQQLGVLFMEGKRPMVTWQVMDPSVCNFYLWAVVDELAEHYGGKDCLFHQMGGNDSMQTQGIEIWNLKEPKTPEERVRIEPELRALFPAIRQRVEIFAHPREE